MITLYRFKGLVTGLCLGAAGLTAAPAFAGDAAADLRALFEAEWDRAMEESPTSASYMGDRRFNGLWPDVSLAAFARRHEGDKAALKKLLAIDRDALPPDEQLNYDLFRRQTEESIERHGFRDFLMPLSPRGGAGEVQSLDLLQEYIRLETLQDFEDWNSRLAGIDSFVEQIMALLGQGMKEGRMPPRIIMERLPGQIGHQIVASPGDSPFYKAFRNLPESLSASDRERLKATALVTIEYEVVPAYRKFLKYFNQTYLPASRETHGVWDLPGGEAYYAFVVRSFTTTDLTPREIHELGLSEVERILGLMEEVKNQVGFEGGLHEFNEFLRTDPRFYYADPEALFEGYLAISKRIDPGLVRLFGKLPRMPYGLRPIPDAIAPDTTTAYYARPAADGSRAGYYYVNLYRPEVRPKYEMEVLSVHEAVPGHHLQIALAQELEGLPKFRSQGGITAFVEGWGLYSEGLGEELGLYQDPYSKYGQLTYEMWRAVRLVVDTGMHDKKWTRGRAIAYFKDHAAKTEADIVNEIDRYISWPGQALAYKIGQLKMTELRERARARLGGKFDIREFHDALLGSGAVPLSILDDIIESYIETRESS